MYRITQHKTSLEIRASRPGRTSLSFNTNWVNGTILVCLPADCLENQASRIIRTVAKGCLSLRPNSRPLDAMVCCLHLSVLQGRRWVWLPNHPLCPLLPTPKRNVTGSTKYFVGLRQQNSYMQALDLLQRGLPPLTLNPLNPELNPICYLLALLGAQHFLHVSRIRVKLLTFRRLMSYIYIYIYGAPILDVSRSHTTTQHSR